MTAIKRAMLPAALAGLMLSASATAYADNAATALQNNAFVTLSGTVGEIRDADEFELKYATGTIMVDTNDAWPNLFKQDAIGILKPGDRITVSGRVDENFFTKKEIDATAISHRGQTYTRGKYDAAAYGYWPFYGWNNRDYDDNVTLTGRVNKIIGDDEFEMSYGEGFVRVETKGVNFPDADRLRVGDQVTVSGEMDHKWFGKRELDAEYIVRSDYYSPRG